ncbi:MAG TPA: STAS domain-containing protein [Myxococcaceae bacterium]|nr:STAS domain-containing protein [Myxococcaceae bacterium]
MVHTEELRSDVITPTPKRPTLRVTTLMPEGELGVREWAELSRELDRLERYGVVRWVLDLTDVTHLDYRGVRPLIESAARARRAGGDLKLAGLSPYLSAIFRVAGAYATFEYFRDPLEACAAFEKPWTR